jgi:hypothetical protein
MRGFSSNSINGLLTVNSDLLMKTITTVASSCWLDLCEAGYREVFMHVSIRPAKNHVVSLLDVTRCFTRLGRAMIKSLRIPYFLTETIKILSAYLRCNADKQIRYRRIS